MKVLQLAAEKGQGGDRICCFPLNLMLLKSLALANGSLLAAQSSACILIYRGRGNINMTPVLSTQENGLVKGQYFLPLFGHANSINHRLVQHEFYQFIITLTTEQLLWGMGQ